MVRGFYLPLIASVLFCTVALSAEGGWQPPPSSQSPNFKTSTLADPQMIAKARAIAEQYWNAQKTSDQGLFRSVTPHESMSVVFGWSFVRESPVLVEEGEIPDIRDDLQQCITFWKIYKSLSSTDPGRLAAIKNAEGCPKGIAVKRPFLGEFLGKAYWETITPPTFVDSNLYKLMGYEYIADVEFQSKAGAVLKKRVHTLLRRLIVDGHDSGWKVFFIPGS